MSNMEIPDFRDFPFPIQGEGESVNPLEKPSEKEPSPYMELWKCFLSIEQESAKDPKNPKNPLLEMPRYIELSDMQPSHVPGNILESAEFGKTLISSASDIEKRKYLSNIGINLPKELRSDEIDATIIIAENLMRLKSFSDKSNSFSVVRDLVRYTNQGLMNGLLRQNPYVGYNMKFNNEVMAVAEEYGFSFRDTKTLDASEYNVLLKHILPST